MGGGSWGGDGDKPTRMSCGCLARLGWTTPKAVKRSSALTIPTLESNPGACYRLWTGGKRSYLPGFSSSRSKSDEAVAVDPPVATGYFRTDSNFWCTARQPVGPALSLASTRTSSPTLNR